MPGDVLAQLSNMIEAGEGVYIDKGSLRASLAGIVSKVEMEGGKQRFEVISKRGAVQDAVLQINDIVLARVTKVMQNQIAVEVIAVGEVKLRTMAKGVVRREDMKETETDMLIISDCFRPGDLIRATVLSFGDSRQYYL